MSKLYSDKRFLVTDYYLRDSEIFKDILKILVEEGAHVFVLLNLSTYESDILKDNPKCVPILFNTCRNYQNIDGEDKDVNSIKFKDGPERHIMDSLPAVDHVINFAGPEFAQVFIERSGRRRYKIVNTEFGKIKSMLERARLIPEDCPRTIIHVVPDRPLMGKIFNDDKDRDKHYVNCATGAQEDVAPDDATDLGEQPFSRASVYRRSLSMRVRRSRLMTTIVGEDTKPPTLNERKQEILNKETAKLKERLIATQRKYMKTFERKRKKRLRLQDKVETKLTKRTEQMYALERGRLLKESQSANVSGQLSEDTRNEIDKSKKISAEKHAAKAKARTFKVQSENLERIFQSDLKDLKDAWYKGLLNGQAKVIRKVTKMYLEKIKATEIVFQ